MPRLACVQLWLLAQRADSARFEKRQKRRDFPIENLHERK
jgi:hypothetical protein